MDFTSVLKSKRKPPPPPPPKPAGLTQSRSQSGPPVDSQKKGLGWPWDNPASHFALYTSTPYPRPVSWLFNWELWVPDSIPKSIEWVPCVRTPAQVNDIMPFLTDIIQNKNRHVTALLGFNEPEIPDQANLAPHDAVRLWKECVLPAKQKFGLRLGSPGMSSDVSRSKPWLDAFFTELDGADGIDFLVLHWYGLKFADMRAFLEDMHATYGGRPVWINEFACSRMGAGSTTEEEVLQFVQEAIPWLDGTSWIERYAYYGNGQGKDVGEWVGKSNNFTEVANNCQDTDRRRLTKVGRTYLEL